MPTNAAPVALRSGARYIGSLLLVLCALSMVSVAKEANAAEQARLPNVVLIMADDLGYAELGSYGQTKIRTPALDQMAKAGLRFTQFYAGNPVCATSRCVLMTGLHSGHAAVRDNREVKPEGQFPLPAAAITIAELLQGQGYKTGAIGKWGLGPPGSVGDPNQQGFDLFYGYNCQRHAHNHYPSYLWRNQEKITLDGNSAGLTGKQHTHDLFEAEALKFIEQYRAQPFFLYLPFTIPHVALQVPEDSLQEYAGKLADAPYDGKQGYLPHPTPHAAYAAMVTRLDRSVGRILAKLKDLQLDEQTLVLFTSDNGPTHGRVGGADSEFFHSAGELRGLKGSVYEGGLRVPLIARWPGKIKAEQTSSLPCAAYDLLATLAEVASVKSPPPTDGISLLPTLLGQGEQRQHEFLYWEFPGYGGQQAVRMGDWKGVRQKLAQKRTQIELYNLKDDVSETHDVADKHPEVLKQIGAILAREHIPSPEFPLQTLDKQP